MSILKTERTIRVANEVPAGVSTEKVLEVIQDQENFMRAQPLVQIVEPIGLIHEDYEALSKMHTKDIWDCKSFRITEKVPYWGNNTFTMTTSSCADGVDTVAHVAMGYEMSVTWRVVPQKGGSHELCEECYISGSSLLMPFVESQFKKAHEEMQQKILQRAKRESGL